MPRRIGGASSHKQSCPPVHSLISVSVDYCIACGNADTAGGYCATHPPLTNEWSSDRMALKCIELRVIMLSTACFCCFFGKVTPHTLHIHLKSITRKTQRKRKRKRPARLIYTGHFRKAIYGAYLSYCSAIVTFHSTPHARLSLSTVMAASMSPSKMAPRSISAQHRWIICGRFHVHVIYQL